MSKQVFTANKRKAVILIVFVAYALFNIFDEPSPNKSANSQSVNSQSNYNIIGTVVKVADGDTLTLLSGKKNIRVRLASIDAPETGHGKNRPSQPYSNASKKALSELVINKRLTLVCYEKDHYGREICDIPIDNGRTANQILVEQGLAWANMQGGGKYLRDRSLPDLEKQARQRKIGLWQQPGAVAPWDWRWQCWNKLETGQKSPIC